MFRPGNIVRFAELMRPDSVRIWGRREIKGKLSWYYAVMKGAAPAKFIISKRIYTELNTHELQGLPVTDLWRLHRELERQFQEVWNEVRESDDPWSKLPPKQDRRVSFLEIKVEIAYRMLRKCTLCERRCGVNREEGQVGVCRVPDGVAYVDTYFHHMGEEAPLVPSGTIFYVGCNFRCVFCQNWSISQRRPDHIEAVSPEDLSTIQEWLRFNGARNINHVGGDPTPHLPAILKSLTYLEISVPQLWNSNMYLTEESMSILKDVIDIWLPDFKYGNDSCALKYSIVKNYVRVATRNIKVAHDHGDMIVRHLVLPGHVECCTKEVIKWLAANAPNAALNLMDQYRPEYMVLRHPNLWKSINRHVSKDEMRKAFEIAREEGYTGPYEDLWILPSR